MSEFDKQVSGTSCRLSNFAILEKRARNAINGYAADVNITCYVYGCDVLALLQHVKNLQARTLEVELENERLRDTAASIEQGLVSSVKVPEPTVKYTSGCMETSIPAKAPNVAYVVYAPGSRKGKNKL